MRKIRITLDLEGTSLLLLGRVLELFLKVFIGEFAVST